MADAHPPIDPKVFRGALGCFATGITVVTCDGPEGAIGITANSFSSVSLDPPLVLWCLDNSSETCAAFLRAESFAINILAADQQALSARFATRSNHELGDGEFERWTSGAPVLPQALAVLDCLVDAKHPAGDHTIMVGRVVRIQARDGDPVLYFRGKYRGLEGLSAEAG